MRIAVVGAGAMGGAAAKLLAGRSDADLVIIDADEARARGVVEDVGRGEARGTDVMGSGLADAIRGTDAAAACLPYRLNLQVMEAALAARVPYADLGGLYHMTLRQLELDGRFRDAGVAAVLGIGCCPGISNVLARLGADRLDRTHSIDLFDGTIDPGGGFGVPYSADTILDELTVPAVVFEEGELREVPAGSGSMDVEFPEPIGRMEAVYTLHSELATLPRTIEGVQDVRWRLALPEKIIEGFQVLVDVGLASDEPVETSRGAVVPRELLMRLLARIPQPEGSPDDVEALLVRVTGSKGGRRAVATGQAVFRPTPEGMSAGAFGTALPIVMATQWLADGRVPPGVHPPETAFPPEPFLENLAAKGVDLTSSVEESFSPA